MSKLAVKTPIDASTVGRPWRRAGEAVDCKQIVGEILPHLRDGNLSVWAEVEAETDDYPEEVRRTVLGNASTVKFEQLGFEEYAMYAQVVTGADVWPRVTRLSKGAGPRYVAIAFLGADAPRLLTLKRGDVLVVNAGESALRSGATNPDALQVFVDRGVHVYSLPTLHAKVFANRDHAIVGSANASAHSMSSEEAVVSLTTVAARKDVRDYVTDLASQAEGGDDHFIALARKRFRISRRGGVPGVNAPATPQELVRGPVGALWIYRFHYDEYLTKERESVRLSRGEHRRQAGPSARFGLEPVMADEPSGINDGDVVVFVRWHGGSGEVFSPQVVQGGEERTKSGSWVMLSRWDSEYDQDVEWSNLTCALGMNSDWEPSIAGEVFRDRRSKRAALKLWGIELE